MAFEALEPPCKLDEFREAHGGNYTESDLLALSQAADNTTSIAGPVPNFRLVLKLKFNGVFTSIRGDISSNSLIGKALRTLCAEVNEPWSLDRGADRGLDRAVDQGSERVHEGEASTFEVKNKPLFPAKQKTSSLASGSTHKTKADASGPQKYKGVAIHSRANKTCAPLNIQYVSDAPRKLLRTFVYMMIVSLAVSIICLLIEGGCHAYPSTVTSKSLAFLTRLKKLREGALK